MDKRTLRIFVDRLVTAHKNYAKYSLLASTKELVDLTACVYDAQLKLNQAIDVLPIPEEIREEM